MAKLVRMLAARVLSGLPRDCGMELADLIQAGNIGLLQAERTYSPLHGAPLSGYAKFRIRGEMLDAVRRNSRPSRAGITTLGSTADDGADLEAMIPAPPDSSPYTVVTGIQRAAILGEEVARLPERYRHIVQMRYSREYSLREIGDVLSVHESRVCQLHQTALGRLRRALSRRGVRCASVLM
jgi:RNA polymerase sigma factor for flagellar operon FliA